MLETSQDPINLTTKHGLRRVGSRSKWLIWSISGIVLLVVLAGVGAVLWYQWAVEPRDSADSNKVRVVIEPGNQPSQIARKLEDARVIRSAYAFETYARWNGVEDKLQAGTYAFAPSQSVAEIAEHLTSGKTDQFPIRIVPGWTLKDIRKNLISHGYEDAEITAALSKTYTHPLLASKPVSASLEGYFYPETYFVMSDEPLETTFERIFDEYYAQIKDNKLIDGFTAHGLSIHQAITLASIVQREVPGAEDQKQVAGVFYNRLSQGMVLGSDVTYMYGAELLGVEPSVTLDSPYNTRQVQGLPPTPISNPSLSALEAVATPASHDYLYFLSGDDDVTYFARTFEEHEANIAAHCRVKCSE